MTVAKRTAANGFEAGDRVVATIDLPGVPTGTVGLVTMVAGFTWKRAHVRFENGADLAALDQRQIERSGRYRWRDRPRTGVPDEL